MKYAMELKEAREEGREEGIEVGIDRGDTRRSILVIKNLMDMHMPIDVIAKAVDQTPQYVQQIIAGTQAGQV